ncbi:MAG: Na/Pi cotransporter family protein [Lachnospiraceae bacterium]|nr:Na/Pi cotransporter family protein [Lachnospiraceae bacterium]
MIASTLLTLAGGLGLFLFGMTLMNSGIEKAAGAKLRNILEFFTKNRFSGMLVGIVFTGITQSSSACTMLVVSFVNSGIMTLSQAVGVIFGANIGTTVTSQLVSFNLSEYAPVFCFLGVIMFCFIKREKVQKIGEILTGFGVLFMGLALMSEAMRSVKDIPAVPAFFASLTSPLLAIIIGTVVTAIIQSSSVTVSIILVMVAQGLLDIRICLYIILGCTIGGTAAAMISSLSGKKNAKRAALIHLLFNVFGGIVVFTIFKFGMEWIIGLLHRMSGDNLGRQVANAHSLIKIFQAVILFPFSGLLVKLTYKLVPGEDEAIGYRAKLQLEHIGGKNIFSPATAVFEVTKELERMALLASENLNRSMNALVTLDEEDIDEVYEVEENINFLNHEITNYLVKISQTNLPVDDAKSIGGLFHVVNDIERIGDHAENVADSAKQRKEKGIDFSRDAMKEMGEMLDMVNTIIRFAIEMFSTGNDDHLRDILSLEDAIDEKERELQRQHIARMTRNECTPEAGMLFSDVVSGLERVADHATNIAFSVLDPDPDNAKKVSASDIRMVQA